MLKGKTEQARVRAAEALLNRGWGQPTQPLVHAGSVQATLDEQIQLGVGARAELERRLNLMAERRADGQADAT